jgi:hypothetical protein
MASARRTTSLSISMPKGDLLGDTDTTEFRIAVLHLDDGRDELLGWAFRARLSPPARRGEQQAIFAMGQRFVELE